MAHINHLSNKSQSFLMNNAPYIRYGEANLK